MPPEPPAVLSEKAIDAFRQTPQWAKAAGVALTFAKQNGLEVAPHAIKLTLIALLRSGVSLDDDDAIRKAVSAAFPGMVDGETFARTRRVAARLSEDALSFIPFPTPAGAPGLFAWRCQFALVYEGERRWGFVEKPLALSFSLSMRPVPEFDRVVAQDDDAQAFAELQAAVRPMVQMSRKIIGVVRNWLDDVVEILVSEAGMAPRQAVHTIRQAINPTDLGKSRSATEAAATEIVALLEKTRAKIMTGAVVPAITQRLRKEAGFDDYVARFTRARSLKRRHVLIVGPTNSGKTHRALEIAGKATSAAVLSPLRLLALEHHEALATRYDVVSGMVTGEEVVLPDGYTHVAQTIETLDLGRDVDVAVIDEVQMLKDEDRGWAWTQALVGAPAKVVVSTGSIDVVPIVTRIAALCGEDLEVIRLNRKTPLRFDPTPVPHRQIRRGDAVICFSRRDIFTWREVLVRMGLNVAVVYGALGPEVRRAEAARFREGQADVLVATDAIGMGLNFGPLKRVLFTSLSKWDGRTDRALRQAEILQIAGRAGRYGHHDEGVVAVLDGGPSKRLIAAGSTTLPPLKLDTLFVQPDRQTILRAHAALDTDSLADVLGHLGRHLVASSSSFRVGDLSELIRKARLLDQTTLGLEEKSLYVHCPIDGSPLAARMLRNWADAHGAGGSPVPPAPAFGGGLVELEECSKLQTAFLWLSRRWTDVYDLAEVVRAERKALDGEIARHLEKSASNRAAARRPTPLMEAS